MPPETKPTKDREKDQDSGSDYGGDWSGDEWNDAQVRGANSPLGVGVIREGDWSGMMPTYGGHHREKEKLNRGVTLS